MSNNVYVITIHEYAQGATGCDDAFVLGVYGSKERAVEDAVGEARSKFNHIYCEEGDIGGEELNWGDWENLPDTEAERTEDDDYSKEGVINAIRAAGGSFRVTDAEANFYELKVSEEEIISE
ncbi:MAG: hypothetical protein IKA48_00985 [Fibrobacter sp.]|nr:hypothetical protein [Fibrobacter sp.]